MLKKSLTLGTLLILAGLTGRPAVRLLEPQTGSPQGRPIPASFTGDRIVVTPVTVSGDTLRLLTDTGGGSNMIWPDALRRLALPQDTIVSGRDTVIAVPFPRFREGFAIPLPGDTPPAGTRLVRFPPQFEDPYARDGMLGRTWFADRVWRLDYPRRTLSLLGTADPPPAGSVRVPLGFQTDSLGRRTTHFPRIGVVIDGDTLDLLFDTGATLSLTDSALAALGDGGPSVRGTSFIAEQWFRRWRERHPDWRVIERAERGRDMPLIEVPEVELGGLRVGPVWFTMRPDRSFHEFMSRWMDRRVEGALGGSALRYVKVIVDYPGAAAWFSH